MIVSFDTYRLFFEIQGRKYGRNLSWSWLYIIYERMKIILIGLYMKYVFTKDLYKGPFHRAIAQADQALHTVHITHKVQ